MAKLKLVQATSTNGLWPKLRTAWEQQMKQHGAPKAWAEPNLDHAQGIVQQATPDPRYGIYIACGERHGAPAAPYEGFVHVNFKLFNTSAAEIRLVWNRLAPRFQFGDLRNEVADVQSTFLIGALDLSAGHERKPPVKMFMGNPIDQAFGRQFATIVGKMPAMRLSCSMKGNWLHISHAQ